MLPDHEEAYNKMVGMLNKLQADNNELLQRERDSARAQVVALESAMLYQSNVARFTGFVTALGHNVGWTPDGHAIIEKGNTVPTAQTHRTHGLGFFSPYPRLKGRFMVPAAHFFIFF